MSRVPELDMEYSFDTSRNVLTFEDGTEYSLAEAILLSKDPRLDAVDIQVIHLVKKMFEGEIMDGPGGKAWIPPGSLDLGNAPEVRDADEDFLDKMARELAGREHDA